jgi:protein phosphatase
MPEAITSEIGRRGMLEAYGCSDVGCVRTNNEDSFIVDDDLGLYVLADGMGGAQAGETASRVAVETVVEVVRSSPVRSLGTLIEAFEEANRRVIKLATGSLHLNGMGTTLVGILECGDELAIASVGDSRAYLFEDGKLIPITEDQTWAHEVGRRLGLDEDRLKTHPMRHVLTMAIGVESALRIHSYSVRPAPGVQFLLCSDGLHGVVSPETITQGLSSAQSLEVKCHFLIDAARKAGGPDNITAVLLAWN